MNSKRAFRSRIGFLFLFLPACSGLLYHPTRAPFTTPDKIEKYLGYKPQDVFFSTEHGKKLHAWMFRSTQKKTKAVFVQFHGNAENLTSHFFSLRWLPPEGYDLFSFDYQGYGQSEGEPTPQGTIEDGKAALRYVKSKYPGVPLIVIGQSLGSAIALRTAIEIKDEIPICMIVIESGFLSYQSAGRDVLSSHWFTWIFQPLAYVLLSDKYAPEERVAELSPIPLLVVHGEDDSVVNIKRGEEIFACAKEPKEFWRVPKGRHIDTFFRDDSEYRKKLMDFASAKGCQKK